MSPGQILRAYLFVIQVLKRVSMVGHRGLYHPPCYPALSLRLLTMIWTTLLESGNFPDWYDNSLSTCDLMTWYTPMVILWLREVYIYIYICVCVGIYEIQYYKFTAKLDGNWNILVLGSRNNSCSLLEITSIAIKSYQANGDNEVRERCALSSI